MPSSTGKNVWCAQQPFCLCCRVLVTAPLTVLQAGDIRFQPPLPPRKQVLPCCGASATLLMEACDNGKFALSMYSACAVDSACY